MIHAAMALAWCTFVDLFLFVRLSAWCLLPTNWLCSDVFFFCSCYNKDLFGDHEIKTAFDGAKREHRSEGQLPAPCSAVDKHVAMLL